jgi:putative tryptophan/tyrosine transport system substrate-binding protein
MRRPGVAIAVLAAWIATATLVGPPAPRAHAPTKPARIGYLGYTSPEIGAQYLIAFRERLAELGLVHGTDVVVTARYAAGRYERLPALAGELVREGVSVLVTPGSEATVAATRATTTVPIVMLEVGDPVVHGLVKDLIRPGGNVTGVSGIFSDLAPVHLELLRETVPGASRVVVLWNPDNVAEHRLWSEKQTTARVFGWQLVTAPLSRTDDVEFVLRRALARRADALYSLGDPLIVSERQQIVNFALQHRLPTLFGGREFVDVGGLMAYGPNVLDLYRQAAGFVARILGGARAGDLAVEPPVHYELAINLKTARALGLRVPDEVLARADVVVE